MSVLRKFRKSVEKDMLMFPLEMYNNTLGSLVITHYILAEVKPDVNAIKKQWKKLRKSGIDFWLDDPEFVEKGLALFNMKPEYGWFAMVQSSFNVLFAPYDGQQIFPLREDGMPQQTLTQGKIYPIVKTNNLEE